MKQLKTDCYATDNDTEILSFLNELKGQGCKIPVFDTSRDSIMPLVRCSPMGSFTLVIVAYLSQDDDSGYVMYLFKNFLTSNKVNLRFFADKLKTDCAALVSSVLAQTQDLAKQIDYKQNIVSVFDKDFTGLMAMAEHPIDEIFNTRGHKN